ncbi:Uridine diphosphate glucose pyrophosphatase [hydrothermal vent metagenome]|uniref:Uridine diphosphate glucose pyrophosphatase n=1 Tax=hydrothermal vent metagenome TaxID=652676 RepID=A0A1W1BJ28_9ZZZZ
MKNIIEDFRMEPLVESSFIKTSLAKYRQNGVDRDWEVVRANDSVAILIYHKDREAFVLVKQFRPAVYMANQDGMTVELCAGIIDKNLTLEQIAQEEIEEECGYRVSVDAIEKIASFYSSVGFAGSKQTIYFVEVDESMRVSDGGGVDGEVIEVIELPIDEAREMIYDDTIAKTTGLAYAFMWFFERYR